ncbi:MAG TPA: sulfatase [Opitutaceae bacterium]|nr:sulfatase [Opitutaceae bacterium]
MLSRGVGLLLLAGLYAPWAWAADERPNVLFIAIDDLRPSLGCYGNSEVISPHLDALAKRGLVFKRAYTQQAVCNASRASLMTGLRPDSTGVYDLTTHFRKKVPGAVTLPEHFKHHGYHTQALGKIYHPAFHGFAIGSDLGDEQSWSVPIWMGGPRYYYSPLGEKLTREVYARKTGRTGADLEGWKQDFLRSLATEAPDVPDNMIYDGELTDRSLAALRQLADRRRVDPKAPPFFLAVGYLKPHLPFIAPKQYWDLYDPAKLTLARNQQPPKSVPPVAVAVAMQELRGGSYPLDVKVDPVTARPVNEWSTFTMPAEGPIPPEQQRRLLHGYYACVTFVDAQIGRLLTELKRQGLTDNTIVLVYGDHGFHLGENGQWGKLTNFEIATRCPLIVSAPKARAPGSLTDALVELVDVFPSLCDIAGLPQPDNLEGHSFADLLDAPDRAGKDAAFSQYPRGDIMGYSLRTDRYRFTRWPAGAATGGVVATELYDHATDPGETVNLAENPDYRPLIARLTARLEAGWRGVRP